MRRLVVGSRQPCVISSCFLLGFSLSSYLSMLVVLPCSDLTAAMRLWCRYGSSSNTLSRGIDGHYGINQCMWYVHVVRTCGMYMWCVHVVCTCGAYMWYVHVVRTCGMYMWCMHGQMCTFLLCPGVL